MAKQKRKVTMPAGIRNKMMAAVSMLMVSAIMMVSSTYAWFTLSTAPEVKNISTTVAGNGSLEIALMPASGLFSEIGTGSGTSMETPNLSVITANTTWGNLVTLSGGTANTDYYGLNHVKLLPASLDIATNPNSPLKTAVFGSDGRVANLTANTKLMTYEGGFVDIAGTPAYGVRAIGEDAATTYGYVVDFAVRINTENENGDPANLKLQTEAVQRVYSEGTNPNTLGGGSSMKLSGLAEELSDQYVKELLNAIRITFVANYGKALSENEQITVLGEARLDTSGLNAITQSSEIPLSLYKNEVKDSEGVLVSGLEKNKATQISAIVWLDGANIKNASLAATALNSMQGTLNLQFSTDASLVPANNTGLMNSTGTTGTTTTPDTPDVNPEQNGDDISATE